MQESTNQNQGKNILKYLILGVAFFSIIYFPIFGHLDTLPIRIFDEARLATNAYEMLSNRNYLITTFEGKPDMWNTKPPLLIWIQVFFMRLLGINEIAVRLPSAIAAFLTCISLLLFLYRNFKNVWFGLISIFVLITSHGYLSIHGTRTGDYDAMLTFFTTISALSFFLYNQENKTKYLYLFFVSTTLAVLTKGVAGLLFLPGILIYTAINKKLIIILRNQHFFIGLVIFLIPIFSYYFIRELFNPGYIEAVQENEIGGRFLTVIENHQDNFWFYFKNLINSNLTSWYILIPCGIGIGHYSKDCKLNKLTHYLLILVITYFLIISSAKTKLPWYDLPLYPFLSIIVGTFIHHIFEIFKCRNDLSQNLKLNVLHILFLFLIFINPYMEILKTTYLPKEKEYDKEFYEISYFLKNSLVKNKFSEKMILILEGYNPQVKFYVCALSQNGLNLVLKSKEQIALNETVIVSQDHVKEFIAANYNYSIVYSNGRVQVLRIETRSKM